MKLTFLGTGSAFSMKNFQTNAVIEDDGRRLLLDCGTDIRWSLAEQKLSYKDINAIYISHLHADHIGGMEYMALSSYFTPNFPHIHLYGNRGVLELGWDTVLKGGLSSIQGKIVTLDDYFNVTKLDSNGSFRWGTAEFKIVQTVHIMDGYSIVPSFGLMIKNGGRTTYYVTDSQFCPHQIQDFYNQSDLIFQDCETYPFKSGVHAHYDDLKTLNPATKAKMYLIHWSDNFTDDIDKHNEEAIANGFKGFAKKGQSIEI